MTYDFCVELSNVYVPSITTMSTDTRTANSGKKKGGGFLSRQAKAKSQTEYLTEEELLKRDVVTPDDVLRLSKTTESKCLDYYLI